MKEIKYVLGMIAVVIVFIEMAAVLIELIGQYIGADLNQCSVLIKILALLFVTCITMVLAGTCALKDFWVFGVVANITIAYIAANTQFFPNMGQWLVPIALVVIPFLWYPHHQDEKTASK